MKRITDMNGIKGSTCCDSLIREHRMKIHMLVVLQFHAWPVDVQRAQRKLACSMWQTSLKENTASTSLAPRAWLYQESFTSHHSDQAMLPLHTKTTAGPALSLTTGGFPDRRNVAKKMRWLHTQKAGDNWSLGLGRLCNQNGDYAGFICSNGSQFYKMHLHKKKNSSLQCYRSELRM